MSRVGTMYADTKYHNFRLYEWVESNAGLGDVDRPAVEGGRRMGAVADPLDGRADLRLAGCLAAA